MDLVNDRKISDTPIFRAFVERVLKKRAKDISAAQNEVLAGFSSGFWKRKFIKSDDTNLIYTHLAAHRFVDMKTRRSRGYTRGTRKIPGGKKKKKNFPVHNKPIMRHKKFIVRTLSFGFTDEIKENFRQLAKDEGLIQ